MKNSLKLSEFISPKYLITEGPFLSAVKDSENPLLVYNDLKSSRLPGEGEQEYLDRTVQNYEYLEERAGERIEFLVNDYFGRPVCDFFSAESGGRGGLNLDRNGYFCEDLLTRHPKLNERIDKFLARTDGPFFIEWSRVTTIGELISRAEGSKPWDQWAELYWGDFLDQDWSDLTGQPVQPWSLRLV